MLIKAEQIPVLGKILVGPFNNMLPAVEAFLRVIRIQLLLFNPHCAYYKAGGLL
jgi:hypothetical protein